MTKIALFLSVCYPFIAIPYPQSRKNLKNNKSQVVYDDLKLNGNKVFNGLKKLIYIRSNRASKTLDKSTLHGCRHL